MQSVNKHWHLQGLQQRKRDWHERSSQIVARIIWHLTFQGRMMIICISLEFFPRTRDSDCGGNSKNTYEHYKLVNSGKCDIVFCPEKIFLRS